MMKSPEHGPDNILRQELYDNFLFGLIGDSGLRIGAVSAEPQEEQQNEDDSDGYPCHSTPFELTEHLAQYLHGVCGYLVRAETEHVTAWNRAHQIVSGRGINYDPKKHMLPPVVLDCLIYGTIAGVMSRRSVLSRFEKVELYKKVSGYLVEDGASYPRPMSEDGDESQSKDILAAEVLKQKMRLSLVSIEQSMPTLTGEDRKWAEDTIIAMHHAGIWTRPNIVKMAGIAFRSVFS